MFHPIRAAARSALLLAVAPALVPPSAVAAPARETEAQYVFHTKVLENGLKVVTLEDHSCPIAAVQVWYHVGSKDENPERQGFAHMFEHMMFRGTDRLGPEDHFQYIRGTGGDCNAFTAFDNTTYVQEVPANQVPMVLWLEAERMASLKVDQAGFETERAVVEEEARLGANQPYGTVLEKVLAQVYTQHPYQWSPIGKIEHLRRATAEELLRFWETYYVPNNATLVVVGDVGHAAVEAEAERAFGWIPRCPDPPRVAVKEPLPGEPRVIEIEESKGPVPIIAAAWRTVPMGDDDSQALDLLMAVLGGGESSRLYRKVVDDAEAAVMAAAGALELEDDGIAAAGAVLMPFGDAGAALELIEAEVEKVKAEGVTQAELDKARANALNALVAESRTVASKASAIGQAALFHAAHGGPEWLNGRRARIEAITVEDLQRVAAKYLVPERRFTVKIKPTIGGMLRTLLGGLKGGAAEPEEPAKKVESTADAPMPERRGPKAHAQRPEGYPEHPPRADLVSADVKIEGTHKRLDNGLEVVVVENHEVPLVSVRLGLLNGGYFESTPGAAELAASMLTKGTKSMSAQERSQELESNALDLGADAGLDAASVRGSGPAVKLPRLMQLLSEVVKEPAFPAKEFEKLKRQTLTGLAIAEKSPASIAEREFATALYGAFPYARSAGVTTAGLKALALDDCIDWWNENATPDRAVLYVSGDVTPEDAFELADVLFSDWSGEGVTRSVDGDVAPEAQPTHIVLIDTPGAIQSQIRVGHRGITRAHPDYATARVLTQVFGGAFNSRLNEVIRVKKGLTYGASGGFSPSRFDGRFFVSTFSKTATTGEAVAAILDEVRRMRDEPPTPEELEQARSFLVGSFAGNHETPDSVANELWTQRLNGLPDDFAVGFLKHVIRTSSDDVGRVARELIDPEKLAIVVVGDASKVRADLEKIAPVTVLDEGGKPKAEAPATAPDGDADDEGESDGEGADGDEGAHGG